jgi:hypothetical protein
MTYLLALCLGLAASGALVVAGYQFGVSRGTRARDDLRHRLEEQSYELHSQIQVLTRSLRQHEAVEQMLESDLKQNLDRVARESTDVERVRVELRTMLAPLLERERADDDLRTTMRELLGPLVQRERLGDDLARLDLAPGHRDELPRLLDGIAHTGGFTVVLLSDEAGLPLAASAGTQNPEHYAGLASLLMVLVERLSREPGPPPLAVSVHNAANQQMLSRVFEVSGQQLMLTAVSTGTTLSPTALDPALAKLETVLAPSDVVG